MGYTFKSRVRYSELGPEGRLSLNGVVNYLQDCSTFQSEDLGLGLSAMEAQHKAWFLSSWQIDISKYPRLGEEITIGTWAYEFNALYGFRNFMIQDGSGDYIVRANSMWFLFDTVANKLVKVTEKDVAPYGEEPRLEMEYLPRKIKVMGDGYEGQAFTVPKALLDTNHHVNNGKYIQMAMEFLPEDFHVARVRVEYKKAAVLDDIIIPRIHQGDGGITVSLDNPGGKPYAVVRFEGITESRGSV